MGDNVFIKYYNKTQVLYRLESGVKIDEKWNEIMKNAYSQMRIYDSGMNEIADVKSATYDIPPGMQTTMVYYWDTDGISEGMYNANIVLHYAEKRTQQDLKLDVRPNSIDIIGLGYVISEHDAGGIKMSKWVILLVVLLILINVIWFLALRGFLKSRRKR